MTLSKILEKFKIRADSLVNSAETEHKDNEHNHKKLKYTAEGIKYCIRELQHYIKQNKVFEFSGKATQHEEGIAVDNDGLALSNDTLPHKAFQLQEGKSYRIEIYENRIMKATHKRDGTLNIITRQYSFEYKEYMYLCDNWLWYFESDLKIE